MHIRHDLRPRARQRGPFGGGVAQEIEEGGGVHGLQRRPPRIGGRDGRQAEAVEAVEEGGGAGRDLEVLAHLAAHQEEARAVQFLGRMGKGFHDRDGKGACAALSMRCRAA
jgi:hypothetical protein